jgi:hypothetical protein
MMVGKFYDLVSRVFEHHGSVEDLSEPVNDFLDLRSVNRSGFPGGSVPWK